MSDRTLRSVPWAHDEDGGEPAPARALTRQEAQALRSKEPAVSPWWVVLVQAGVGAVVAAVMWGLWGEDAAVSALYGATTAVLPGALMARGMTSQLTSASPGTSAVSFMAWEMVKMVVSVGMLMLAPKLVQPLSWPALLVALVLCIKVYWLALLWRGRSKKMSRDEH